jgi:hypothetical protein
VGGGFPGEVPGIKLGERGVDLFGVKYDARREPFVGVGLDDQYDIELARLRVVAAQGAKIHETKPAPPGRNNGRRQIRPQPDIDRCPHVFHRLISTTTNPSVHSPTAVIERVAVGE